MVELFGQVDVLALPTTQVLPFLSTGVPHRGRRSGDARPPRLDDVVLRDHRHRVPRNLNPAGFHDGLLPASSSSAVGRRRDFAEMAAAMEAAPYHHLTPEL